MPQNLDHMENLKEDLSEEKYRMYMERSGYDAKKALRLACIEQVEQEMQEQAKLRLW